MGENFRKLVKRFLWEIFCGLLTGAAKSATCLNFIEKTFANSHKTLKFSPSIVPSIRYANNVYHTSNSHECMGVNGEALQLHSAYKSRIFYCENPYQYYKSCENPY